MREETPVSQVALPTYSPTPSNPRRLWVRQLSAQQVAVVKQMRERIRELKKNGLKPMNIYNYWLGRHLPLWALAAT
jgi:hypothetical protein